MTGNLFSDLSDHLPVFSLLLNSDKRSNLNERPLVRLFTESNKLKYEDCLSKIDWPNLIYNNNDVNDYYGKFISATAGDYEKCFPLTHQSGRAFNDKKWITSGLRA